MGKLRTLLSWFFKGPPQMVPNQHETASGAEQPLLVTALPELGGELEALLNSAGKAKLAAQVPGLRIVDRCRCGDDFCATFHVQPKPEASYGPGHRNIALEPKTGMLILDVVDDNIAAVEVLYRDDVRTSLHELLP
jgi:hypothetical protein